jgi:hypothetical protein
MKSSIFFSFQSCSYEYCLDVMYIPCSRLKTNQRFGRKYRYHLQGTKWLPPFRKEVEFTALKDLPFKCLLLFAHVQFQTKFNLRSLPSPSLIPLLGLYVTEGFTPSFHVPHLFSPSFSVAMFHIVSSLVWLSFNGPTVKVCFMAPFFRWICRGERQPLVLWMLFIVSFWDYNYRQNDFQAVGGATRR